MRTLIHEVKGKLRCEWDSETKTMVDTWTTYSVSLEEFKEAVLVQGVNFAKNKGVKAWIVDSHNAKGAFLPEIHAFIESDIFPAFAKIGVKHFLTIDSDSAITNMTISRYSSKAGPSGINLVKCTSVQGAMEWLKKHSAVKV